MGVPMLRRRPSRAETERAALALIARHGGELLATARRYSAGVEDAEDAYQRGLEILLQKAPTTELGQLLPWLKTVIKHEAFAVRRQRERAAPVGLADEPPEPPGGAEAHAQAERYERLRLGAEALGRLKPQEMRALRLKAEGYSYEEISAITGWSHTKVNRCISEGRRSFLQRVAGIEAGLECESYVPLLSALADGEATGAELARLRPHLRTCLCCRKRLREFRAAPTRVAALLPPLALGGAQPDASRSLFESLLGAAQHKAAALGERAHTMAELATGQKVAAVAASAAALAGGGAAVDDLQPDPSRPRPEQIPAEERSQPPPPATPVVKPLRAVPPVADPVPRTPPRPQPAPAPTPAERAAAEFAPAAGPVAASATPPTGSGASGGSTRAQSAGGGEFAP